jgi:hypothetical protein
LDYAGLDRTVWADRECVRGQLNSAFQGAVDIEILVAEDFAFDRYGFSDTGGFV